ncbi:MAG: hypothetical protein WBW61_01730 [Rhodanobacteraceae bacterium]
MGFVYRTALEPEEWPIRACQCEFCRAQGALSTSDPRGSLEFFEHVPSMLNRYRFGRKTADFLICRNCGAFIGAMMQSESRGFGIINVRILLQLADRLRQPRPMDYENEELNERAARRESRWTPVAIG